MLVNVNCLKIAAALVMTASFIPMLFQGEEWGASTPFFYFSGHRERELGYAVSEGRKREFSAFGWNPDEIADPQALETFMRSKLDWSELAREPHADLLQWHRELIRLRRQSTELTDGRLDKVDVKFDEQARWLTMRRGPIAIVINFARQGQTLPLPHLESYHLLLASHSDTLINLQSVKLPPESVAIMRIG